MSWPEYMNGFWGRAKDPVNRMLSWDYDHYLSENLLVKIGYCGNGSWIAKLDLLFWTMNWSNYVPKCHPKSKSQGTKANCHSRNFLELNNLERLLTFAKERIFCSFGRMVEKRIKRHNL